MIFKKPYAFLIKNFKLINLLLTVLIGYLTYRTYHIISFFAEYISNQYSGSFYHDFYLNYITPNLFLIIILIVLGIGAILLLFIYKKKPLKVYAVSVVYFIAIYIYLIFIKNVMISLETTVITAEMARIYRDLSIIAVAPQVVFIILFLIRGLGFNIKQFNFQNDLKELEIASGDSEEVELVFKNDGTILKRTIRRFIREFKYYVLENKLAVIIATIIVVCILIFVLYKALPEIYDKNFSQGQAFVINDISYRLKDSIVTNINYKGNTISEDDYYVVVKLEVTNSNDVDYQMNFKNFRLELNNSYIYPTPDKSQNFMDYAIMNSDSLIRKNTVKDISLIFPIKKEDIKKNYTIKVENGYAINKGISIGKYNYIRISPIIVNKVSLENTYNLNDTVNFSNSNLGKTSLTINNPTFTKEYVYEYEYCAIDGCKNYKNQVNINYLKNSTILLVLDYQYILDETVPFASYSKKIDKLITSFARIKYLDSDKHLVYGTINHLTPQNLKDKIILEIPKEVEDSDEVYLSLVIRNKEYLIRVK